MQGPEFTFESVNNSWRALVSPREYQGISFYQAYPEFRETEIPKYLRQVYEEGVTFTANEMKLRIEASRGNFEYRYYDFSMIRVLGGVGEPYGIFCHMIDVTERVETRLKLEQNSIALANTIKELEKERGMREQFVATLTHDLRTPLTSAMMNAQILARKPIEYANVKLLAERITQSMTRADRMIEDLLDVGRIKAGETLPLDLQECALNEIVQSTVADLTTVYGNRFVLKFSGNLVGYWDESALRRVIENLASNAVKYGTTPPPVTISVSDSGDEVLITVHNKGNPIPSTELKQLFTHYKRSDSAAKSLVKGWGIGLTLVRGITEAHSGTLHVESSEAEGTTFSVRLPRKKEKS